MRARKSMESSRSKRSRTAAPDLVKVSLDGNQLLQDSTDITHSSLNSTPIISIHKSEGNTPTEDSASQHTFSRHLQHLPNIHKHRSKEKSMKEEVVEETTEDDTKEAKEESMKKSDSTGLFSSLLNAAHHALVSTSDDESQKQEAKSVSSKEKKEHSFAHKLEALLKPSSATNGSKSSIDEKDKEDGSELTGADSVVSEGVAAVPITSVINTSQIQFEPVRESPLNTLGHGDLTLDVFEELAATKSAESKSANGSIRRSLTSSPAVERRKSGSARKLASPSGSVENVNDAKAANFKPKATGRQTTNNFSTVTSANTSQLESVRSTPSSHSDEAIDSEDEFSNVKISSEKRNKEFHQLFKQVPQSEVLIDNFSCALSRDILVQGRMFLSKNYLCFNSNILGWVTHLVIPLQEVIQIEKKSTAVLFPNGIVIRTLHQRYVFATFLSRDTTFSVIRNVWHQVLTDDPSKLIRPKRARRSTESSAGHTIDDDLDTTDGQDLNGLDDDDYDDKGSDISLNSDENHGANGDSQDLNSDVKSDVKADGGDAGGNGGFSGLPSVGPSTHAPTENGYVKQAGDTFICDETVRAPIGVVFLLLYGPDKSYYIKLLKEQKNFDITEDGITELSQSKKERSYSYIKPLSGPIGPKQTKCLLTDKLLEYDLEKCIIVESITQTPDVPSGNSFKVRSKTWFSWGPNNSTRVYCITAIDWTGKSWIKGAIEKGSIDGQKDSMKSTISFLNSTVSAGSKTKKAPGRKARSRRNTVSKKTEVKEEKPVVPEKPDTIVQHLSELVNSLGKMVPIPMLSESIVGLILLVAGFLISLMVFNRMFSHSSPYPKIQFLPGDAFISKVKINEHDFLIMPTVDTNLKNDNLRIENEVNLWKWLEDRSDLKLSIKRIPTESNTGKSSKMTANEEYQDQILRELVKITDLRLRKLSEKLNNT